MRGEHLKTSGIDFMEPGSPPHARGTLFNNLGNIAGAGITPACAGNTKEVYAHYLGRWDHPRMRGEHNRTRISLVSYLGSPPHARGTPMEKVGQEARSKDHPRMRGEHDVQSPYHVSAVGSPPHARGTPKPSTYKNPLPRITPACAGNTVASP